MKEESILVITDGNGVVVSKTDAKKDLIACVNELRPNRLTSKQIEDAESHISAGKLSLSEAMKKVCPGEDEVLDQAISNFIEKRRRASIKVLPGAVQAIGVLVRKKFQVIICTRDAEEVFKKILRTEGLINQVEVVGCGEKSKSECLQEIALRFPDHTKVCIGDDLSDRMPESFGSWFLAVLPESSSNLGKEEKFRHANATIVNNLEEAVEAILERFF